MTDLFDDLARRGDADGDRRGLRWRRLTIGLLTVVPLLGLLDVFGQRQATTATAAPQVRLRLEAPRTLRGGLLFEARVDIRALQDVQHPRLVLDRGWNQAMQINSVHPQPVGETSRGGRLVLSYDGLSAGDTMRIWFEFQLEPATVGNRPFGIELDDAEQPLARIGRTLTVLP